MFILQVYITALLKIPSSVMDTVNQVRIYILLQWWEKKSSADKIKHYLWEFNIAVLQR